MIMICFTMIMAISRQDHAMAAMMFHPGMTKIMMASLIYNSMDLAKAPKFSNHLVKVTRISLHDSVTKILIRSWPNDSETAMHHASGQGYHDYARWWQACPVTKRWLSAFADLCRTARLWTRAENWKMPKFSTFEIRTAKGILKL